jgi:hypothetical protein
VVPPTGHDRKGTMTTLERLLAVTMLALIWTLLPV